MQDHQILKILDALNSPMVQKGVILAIPVLAIMAYRNHALESRLLAQRLAIKGPEKRVLDFGYGILMANVPKAEMIRGNLGTHRGRSILVDKGNKLVQGQVGFPDPVDAYASRSWLGPYRVKTMGSPELMAKKIREESDLALSFHVMGCLASFCILSTHWP